MRSWGHRSVWGQSGTSNLQSEIAGVGCWNSLPGGGLPAGWLEKLR